MIEIRQYVDSAGRNSFLRWFRAQDDHVQTLLSDLIGRLEDGNTGVLKSVGHGVFELRLHFGPGYRVYVGRDGDTVVILLGGGTKKRQQDDIEGAQLLWQEYKRRKSDE